MSRNNPRWVIFMPVFLAIAVIFGMFIGKHLNTKATDGPGNSIFNRKSGNGDKIGEVLDLIHDEYVDTMNMDKLTEKAIVAILEQLDPHSSYIPPVELQASNEELEGNFEGIGVEFNLLKDTIVVVSAIPGGPSEAVGIHAGDRIVKIDGEEVAGKNFKNEDVIKRLRGKKGTKVKVEISRKGGGELLAFTIKRDRIPLFSMEAAYMVDKEIGYIKINRFAETTYDEYMEAFDRLTKQGMKKLILDLRGNPGGYLNAATDLADEFLSNKKMIVYTEGQARKKKNYYATSSGKFESQPLVVLIDEGSASASEIVSGAIQDNDRGTIIGRRSFGKGLVQEQIEFKDGSALRLTVARYYTATGRSIQRSYANGVEKYYEDVYLSDGSPLPTDTTGKDTLQKYTTAGGKVVYGGGGITPDIYVPYDTSAFSPYLSDVISKGLTYDFSFDYADKHRDQLLKKYSSYKAFQQDPTPFGKELVNEFANYAAGKGVPRNDGQLLHSARYLEVRLKALIARNVWNNDAFYYIVNQDDHAFTKAVNELRKQ